MSRRALLVLGIAAASYVVANHVGVYAQRSERPALSETRIVGGVPGRFDYYALVMSWSPTHCATTRPRRNDTQCNRRDGKRFSFILHGLWPQYERGYPQSCPTGKRPFVPNATIDSMMDVMPSRGLIIHEYRKHGVCSGLGPEGYYKLARHLYGKITIPRRFVSPTKNQMIDRQAVVDAFVAANPGLKPDMIAVSCGRAGSRLKEVRICFSRVGRLRKCGFNESRRRLCRSDRVYVPPIRVGRTNQRRPRRN